jgi:hypothetical protein
LAKCIAFDALDAVPKEPIVRELAPPPLVEVPKHNLPLVSKRARSVGLKLFPAVSPVFD